MLGFFSSPAVAAEDAAREKRVMQERLEALQKAIEQAKDVSPGPCQGPEGAGCRRWFANHRAQDVEMRVEERCAQLQDQNTELASALTGAKVALDRAETSESESKAELRQMATQQAVLEGQVAALKTRGIELEQQLAKAQVERAQARASAADASWRTHARRCSRSIGARSGRLLRRRRFA